MSWAIAGIDNKGLAGIERGFDEFAAQPARTRCNCRSICASNRSCATRSPRQMTEFNAVGGSGLIMDVHTGEVARASCRCPISIRTIPAADARPTSSSTASTLGTYEMGSVFKIFTMAMALEDHVTTMNGGYDATNPIQIGRFTIHDDHAQHRWLTVPEIFQYSSNIGAAKMALDVGADRQREFLGTLGLLKAPSFELPEVGGAAGAHAVAADQHR